MITDAFQLPFRTSEHKGRRTKGKSHLLRVNFHRFDTLRQNQEYCKLKLTLRRPAIDSLTIMNYAKKP